MALLFIGKPYWSFFILFGTASILCQQALEPSTQESKLEIVLAQSRESCLEREEASSNSVYLSMDRVYSSLRNISALQSRKKAPIHIVTPCVDIVPAFQLVSQLTSKLNRIDESSVSINSPATTSETPTTSSTFNAFNETAMKGKFAGNSSQHHDHSTTTPETSDIGNEKEHQLLTPPGTQLAGGHVQAFIYSCNGCSPTQAYGHHVSRAVAAILDYNHVCRHYLFYQGKLSLSDFMQTKSCRKIVYDVSNFNSTQIGDVISGLQFSDSAVILTAGSRNREIFTRVKEVTPSIYIKVFVVLNETSETSSSWDDVAGFGDRLVVLNTDGITKAKCLSLSEPDENIKLKIQYFSQEAESLQHGGFWSSFDGLHLVQKHLWHFQKFQHKVFNITSLFLPIFHYYNEERNGVTQWKGLAIDLLDALAQSLNFTYHIYESPDKKWGGIENGKWNGMVKQVMEGLADFAVGKFTVSHIRDTVIDFSTPYWFEPTVMAMRRPKQSKLLIFARPLSDFVWACMFVSLPFMGATVFLTTYLHDPDVTKPCDRSNVKKMYKHFKRGLTYAYGAAMHQSLPWIPATLSLRVVFVFWWFSVTAMVAVYTGNLTAVLAVPRRPSPINTLDELAGQTKYRYGVVDSSALEGLFAGEFQHKEHVYKRLFDRSIRHQENLVTSHLTGLQRALKEDYVYIGEYSGVTPYVFSDCNLIMGKQQFYPSSFAFVFPEHSPYVQVFNRRIMQLYDAGMVKYWRGQHYPKNKCLLENENNSTGKKASLADTQGAFVVLLTGILMGCAILLVEWVVTLTQKDSYRPSHSEATATNP